MKPETRLVQGAGIGEDPHRAVSVPIYQTSTFEQSGASGFDEYDYSRSGNPTRAALERQAAELEGASAALAFASGMAGVSAVLRLVDPGDEVVVGNDLYGGTCRFLAEGLERVGVRVRYADTTDASALGGVIGERTRLVFIETPSNPFLRITDIRAVSEAAHASGALVAVDGTLTTPLLQRPLDHGADLVIHSATKALCGHSDVTAGIVAVRDAGLAERLKHVQNTEGTALGPFESWLLIRGMKTLGLRMERQQKTASRLARLLAEHPRVERVYHPSLEGHAGADVHRRQARGPGSLVSFEARSAEEAVRVAESTRLFRIAVSFSSVTSTISVPAHMSHASVPADARASVRIPPALVRLSAGIEDPDDLAEDLTRALDGGGPA